MWQIWLPVKAARPRVERRAPDAPDKSAVLARKLNPWRSMFLLEDLMGWRCWLPGRVAPAVEAPIRPDAGKAVEKPTTNPGAKAENGSAPLAASRQGRGRANPVKASAKGRRRAGSSKLGGIALVAASMAAFEARAEPCGDLLIVLDRSGSMAQCTIAGRTKEAIAKEALKGVVAEFPTVPMGLFVFPDTLTACVLGDGCRPGKEVVPLSATGGMMLSSWLDKMPLSCGGTPTGASMQRVKDYGRFAPGREHYILLLTDGVPTCDDGENMGDGGVVPCNGGGCEECRNPVKVFDAISALRAKGVNTFVVGFDAAMASCPMLPPTCANGGKPAPSLLNKDTLNRMAELGGEARPAPTLFYVANDAVSLKEALKAIVGKVAGGTVAGCVKGGAEPGGAADAGPPADAGGAGAGGGGGGWGGVGGGGPGGSGNQGGNGQGEGGSTGSSPGQMNPGCLCGAGGTKRTGGPGVAACFAVALAAALSSRGRRRRR